MDPMIIHRRRWATLGVLCVSLLIIGLDNTVLNVALATLQRELDATAGQLQWIVDSYTLAFAGLLLLAGAWGDKYGRRVALIAGLAVFGVSSVWAALCTTPEQLIAARGLMGIGGAMIMPSTLSILTNSFTDPRERKTAIGIWAGVSGIGIAAGPALGGYLLDQFHWSSVFYINIPVVIIGLIGTVLIVAESRDVAAPKLDLVGGLLSVVGLVALVWAIIEAPGAGWSDPKVLIGFSVAAVTLAAFALWELRIPHPMLDMRFFKNRRFSIPSISITLVFFVLLGAAFFLSLFMQTVLGYGALEAGIRLLPIAAGLVFGAPLAMAVAQRIGEKIPITLGMLMLAVSFVVIAGSTVDTGYGRVFTSIFIMGFGISFAMTPATEAVMGSL
ncbi:MAG: DHA2 family efflux MFS transporter permease subunit, partial [Longispora sp.]|nr:DHA2 family efflux MFS transporter permease subunit [Longispora sp. (in: high G+C Gram-positive bacteria)]